MYGEKIVAIFAPALQIPKAVPANMAGNIWLFAKKQTRKVSLTPPFEKSSMYLTKSGAAPDNMSRQTPPTAAAENATQRENLMPSF